MGIFGSGIVRSSASGIALLRGPLQKLNLVVLKSKAFNHAEAEVADALLDDRMAKRKVAIGITDGEPCDTGPRQLT